MSQEELLQLTNLLFPKALPTPQQLEEQYPPRNLPEGARVTRYAPSPTGHMHLGNLFSAFISERVAHTTGGVFFVRIEDTDKKREIEDGVSAILQDLASFGFQVDEGVTGVGEETGIYGPFHQRQREEIYHVYARELTLQGLAYPCFCTADELSALRERQEAQKLTPGYYGEFAACRNLTLDEIKAKLDAGLPYVLRLRSPGKEEGKVFFDDMIKGKIEMPENTQDVVLLKSDGIPTYHFAHVVDDHLMRTTHVVRGDEWIASAPIHLQLFKLLGFKPPKYAHIAPLMKEDNGGKRKLSKRKDLEAAVSYYFEQGYPAGSVKEYLLTLANSNFEEWRKVNGDAPQDSFAFNLKKMSSSGALVDLVKFNDVSKNVISRLSAEAVAKAVTDWAGEYDKDFHQKLTRDEEFTKGIFAIDRGGNKPRKDLACWRDAVDYTAYFFDAPTEYDLPENISAADAAAILERYVADYDHDVDKDGWFNGLKAICPDLGYSPDVKAYKKDPDAFKGHVGDVSTVVRLAITGRRNTPDLYAIMQLLGKDECVKRIQNAMAFFRQ
ncbi:MAG: glutamate--tRNA ligase [Clostridia bacterium]|nr:glutamate--tRNA ligase [Clostridia bacterium]